MSSQDGRIAITFEVSAPLAIRVLELTPTELTPILVRSRGREFFDRTLGNAPLRARGVPCSMNTIESEPFSQYVRLSMVADCPRASVLQWNFPFLHREGIPRTFQLLVKANFGGAEHVYAANAEHDEITIAIDAEQRSLAQFVLMGVEHIGASPSEWYGTSGFHFPAGIDHVLFLIGLILAGGSLAQMVKTATGFTVGHSVTLALASLGIVRLPSRIVESCIALSIAYVAVETLLIKEPRSRWRIASAFGLVHGFGFAAALNDLDLTGRGMAKALVGFNSGVEIGQIILVALMFPCIRLFRKQPVFRSYAVPSTACVIFASGAYWFVRRAFGG